MQESVTVGVDASVLQRIAKMMSYLRLGSSGKVWLYFVVFFFRSQIRDELIKFINIQNVRN